MTDVLFSEDEILQREMYLELRKDGVGPIEAGIQVDWTPAKTRQTLADPEFARLVKDSMQRLTETVVHSLIRQARKGNMAAIQMFLYNRDPENWKDRKMINVSGEITTITRVEIGVTKTAVLELLAERGVGALQPPVMGELGSVIDVESEELDGPQEAG